jgi:hypothetical protein
LARQVRVEILADATKYTRGIKDAQRSTQNFTTHTNRAGTALKAAFATFSAGMVVRELGKYVAAARDSNKTAAQTATVLKSTHGAAGLTADQFAKLATQISKTSAVDDDLIQSGENIIATFTQIHGNVFKKTTQAAVDMTAAMNHGEVTQQGLQSSSILLGKALNDPLRGLSALTRVGVTFSAQQREQIADFVKHGQVAKAQGVILAEVNREFGGSAAAAVTPAKQLAVTWGNMQEVLGNLLIPAIDRGAQILSSILGVVDRNRTAFGVLFGVLGTGAAVLGTLIVAEKIHSAVTDGVKAATAAWAGVQKGMNLVLGTTRLQAAATAAAEAELAASTTAAGTAAAGASASIGAGGLAGGLRTVAGAAAGPLAALAGLAAGFGLAKQSIKDNVSMWDEFRSKVLHQSVPAIDAAREAADKHAGATKGDALAVAYSAKQTEAQRLEMVKAIPQFQTSADKVALNAEKAKDLAGKLSTLKDQWKQQVGAVKDAILSYDGLISESKVTAGQVVKDLHNQVTNFKQYSTDVHRLIKAGVSPAAIQELSQKGPQYVHALATGSGTELARYKKFWHDRQSEVKTSFAGSMQQQFEDLVKKMRAMQREINKLKGKTVDVTASTKVDPNVLKVFTAAGGRVKMMARGGRITDGTGPTADDVLIRASKDETMVSAAHSRHPVMQAAFSAVGVPGYAAGGRVYSAELGMRNRASGLMVGSASRAAKLYKQMVLPDIPSGGGAGSALAMKVAQWTISALRRPLGEVAAWFRRLMFESGGNPRAINRTDSNWVAGHPSVGIAQVIRGTFAGNAGRFRNTGPFAYGVSMNPYANSFAGAHYAIGRYGSLFAVDPRMRHAGYDRGGWLQPGMTMAYNGTGRSEPVGLDSDDLANKIAAALVKALRAEPPVVSVDAIHAGLLGKKGRTGGISLGLT